MEQAGGVDNLRKQADMSDRTCSVEGCDRIHRAKGFCSKHYYALRSDLCTLRGCLNPLRANGLCLSHYREHSKKKRSCPECGVDFTGHERRKYCSTWCKAQGNRSPMRKAVEAGDAGAVLAAARECSEVSASGCWFWRYATNGAGYPMIGQGGRGGLVHRHVMAAFLGMGIGDEPVHHKCANPRCINPEHLQLTTHRENMAEMLGRNYFVRRIAALEGALRDVAPSHPLLLQGAPMHTITSIAENVSSS